MTKTATFAFSARAGWALWIAAAILIGYGSLFPFGFTAESAGARFEQLFSDWTLFTSKGDVLGNVALFVPLGFATAWIASRKGHAFALGLAVLGIAIAFALQMLQVFLPTRSAAIADVLWNAIGIALGFAFFSLLSGTQWIRQIAAAPANGLALALIVVWCVLELLPLIPSLDFEQIKDNLKPLFLLREFYLAPTLKSFADIMLVGTLLHVVFRPTMSVIACAALIVFVVLGKVISIQSSLASPQLLGFGIGMLGVISFAAVDQRARTAFALTAAVVAYLVDSAWPLNLSSASSGFGLLPFGGFLRGSMLVNAKSLLSMVFTFGSILFLLSERGGRAIGAAITLAILVLIVEVVQVWIAGRTGEITPVLIVIALGIGIQFVRTARAAPEATGRTRRRRSLSQAATEHTATAQTVTAQSAAGRTPLPPTTRPTMRSIGTNWRYGPLIAALAMAATLYVVLRIPGMPYNVRELFLWDGAFPFLVLFSLAVLWVGFGARCVALWVAQSTRPALALFLGCMAAALISLLLLMASVTDESLDDICGSNNLHWFIVNKSIWGDAARGIFSAVSPELVGVFERPVRFAALYTPLTLCLALIALAIEKSARHLWSARKAIPIVVVALALFITCKAIAFDWSSTDNLNELIARSGPGGLPGGVFLYALLVVGSANAVALSQVLRLQSTSKAANLVLCVLSLPLSWWLLNAGLEQHVEKYELVFSGVQFLLGPDRQTALSQSALFARWSIVYLGGSAVLALGAAFANIGARPWISLLPMRTAAMQSS